MKDGLIIRTEQSIPSLKLKLPEGLDESEYMRREQQIVYLFERAYRQHGVELKVNENEYFNFTIRTMNYDGECKTELLLEAYKHFEEIRKILNLEIA